MGGSQRSGVHALFSRLFQRPPAGSERPLVRGRPARVPHGVRVYAIGDVHGRLDLLQELEERILEDLGRDGRIVDPVIVHLGDYVDRGLQSRQLLDHLLHRSRLADLPRVFLRGNHDLWMRLFLAGEEVGESWLEFGGRETLASYGVPALPDLPPEERFPELRRRLAERVPAAHVTFLDRLEDAFVLGDYFFCHAGIRPGVPLEEQDPRDLLWIREPFLSWRGDPGRVVVHGHTVSEEPVVRTNRIGVDTGAYLTNRLTALVLEDADWRFLQTGS